MDRSEVEKYIKQGKVVQDQEERNCSTGSCELYRRYMRKIVSTHEGYTFFIENGRFCDFVTGECLTGQEVADSLCISRSSVSEGGFFMAYERSLCSRSDSR